MLMLNCDCSIVFMNKNLIFVALPCFSIRNLQKEKKNPFFEILKKPAKYFSYLFCTSFLNAKTANARVQLLSK